MGTNYEVKGRLNGHCEFWAIRRTNHLFVALWYLIVISVRYPIVNVHVRRGYVPCEKCEADYCDKSPLWDKKY